MVGSVVSGISTATGSLLLVLNNNPSKEDVTAAMMATTTARVRVRGGRRRGRLASFHPCLCLASQQQQQQQQQSGGSGSGLELVENKKYNLLRAIQDTQRGRLTTPDQRCYIQEALLELEACDAGAPIDLAVLDGGWRLQYTSAPDVLFLLDSSQTLPFFQVGQIFQKFECRGQRNGGYVRNVVRWSIPNLLEDQEGATLLVSANFSVVSPRNIFLRFEEIAVQNINISENLQAVLAPAMLPRTYLSLQILQAIRVFKAEIPARNPGRASVGGLYYLSYMDNDMLLGHAVGSGGVFIFTRAHVVV